MFVQVAHSNFWEQFLRSIGLAVATDAFNHVLPGRRGYDEQKKVVVDKSRKLALGRCSVHLLPVTVSILIIVVNFEQVFIGIDFRSVITSETINLALLQTAAKLQELLIVASLATVIFQLLRHELIHGDGLPLGLLAAGFDFTKLSYFWSPEWLGSMRNTRANPRRLRKLALILFLVTVGALAALAGPSCAVLLIPQSQDWPAGSTTVLLNGTRDEIWPTTLSAHRIKIKDLCSSADATEYGVCLSGGYYSQWAHYAQVNAETFESAIPNYAKLLSGNDYYWPIRSSPPVPVPAISLGILGERSVTFIQPSLRVVIELDHVMQEWWQTLRLKRGYTDQNVDDRAAVAHVLSPMTTVKCSAGQNISKSDELILFPGSDSPKLDLKRNISESLLDNRPSQHARFAWVPPGEQADTVSTSAVYQSPWTSDNKSRIVVGCTIQAQWVPTQIHTDAYSFWQGWYPKNISFREAIPFSSDQSAYNGRTAIAINDDWLGTLTPYVGKGRPGYQEWEPTTIEGILNSAHLVDGLFDNGNVPVDGWNDQAGTRVKLLMSIIGSVFNDGLARVGIEDAFDRTGQPSTWKPSNPEITESRHIAFPGTKTVHRLNATSDKTTRLRVDFSISGLSYRLTLVQKLAMAVLLLHIVIAVAHVAWILWRCESSGCWDSIIEILVLAQNSRPAYTALGNTAAGIKHSHTFAKKVTIRPTRASHDAQYDHLEMIYEGEGDHGQDNDSLELDEMTDLNENQYAPARPRRVSHPSTWPVRRHHSQRSSSASVEHVSEPEVGPATPLISVIERHHPHSPRVVVGCAYGPTQPPSGPRKHRQASSSPSSELHNPHAPLIVESPTIEYIDLDNSSFSQGEDRILILTPLRDAASHLDVHFRLLSELSYPHRSIDLAFLVGDSKDDTLEVLTDELKRLQAPSNPSRFRSTMVVEKDFGDDLPQTVEERHSLKAQGPRRKGIGRARNYLLYAALKPEHQWVLWRDVDIVENPTTVIEDLIKHDRDVIVPNIWFHRGSIEGRYDYNSWQESWRGRRLKLKLDKDTILAEGYKEYRTHRSYLNWMAHDNKKKRQKNLHKEVALDGIGGVNILVKADVHRSGINFPCYAFENQADTEGFAAMAKRAGYGVYGLPNYVVWHIDTEEKEGNLYGRKKTKKGSNEQDEDGA
ncbi:MAG: hypothetical protein Q9218_005140 [Villophora microphyllina]